MSETPLDQSVLRLAADIVTAHVSRNHVPANALPELIQAIYAGLKHASAGREASAAPKPAPAVPVKSSVFPDHIVCLEDGKKMKMLKRHLKVSFGLTPDEYRQKWGLPHDYPMVAPDYAAKRGVIAKQSGLGRRQAAFASGAGEPRVQRIPEGKSGKKLGRPRKAA